MFKQTPNAMQNGSSSLRPQPTQAYDTSTSLQSFAPQHQVEGTRTRHCTLYMDGRIWPLYTFVGILASIRWVPRNAFFFAVPKTSNTCLSLRPNFSGDSGSSSPATAVPEISHLTASKQGAMFHAQKFATTTQLWSREKSWNSHIKKKIIRSSILPLWCFINDWWLLGLLTVLITLTATVLPPLAALLQSLLKRFLWSIFHHRPQNSSKFLDKGRTGVLQQHKSSAHFSVRVHTNWHHSLQPEGKKTAPKMQFYHGTFVRSSISTFPPRNSQSPQ